MEEQQPPQQSGVGDLQFRRAEFTGGAAPELQCTACQQATGPEYFQVGGAPVCARCATIWQQQQGKPAFGALLRGATFGLGGALAGGFGVGLVSALTGFQLAIAAIGVGWLVGRAFRVGTGGLGGRGAQIWAAGLAYLGICMSYLPVIWKELGAKPETAQPVVRAIGSFVIALLAPVLELTAGGGLSGILGIIIVAVGVMQAWRMMARDGRMLTGPYSTRPPAAEAEPGETTA